jgi:hypothetical protein
MTGTAWLLLPYFGQTEGPFGLQANPLEPWSLRIPPGEASRPVVSAIHWVIGLVSLPLFVWHYVRGRNRRH